MHKAEKQVATELTTLGIYPHTDSMFHYFMGLVSVLLALPAGILILPLLIVIKAAVMLLVYLPLLQLAGPRAAHRVVSIKNAVLMPFHHAVYKLYYAYMAIWLACFYRFDDHWYGIDISGFRDFDDYMSSYRDSRVRWRFKKKLKTYRDQGIREEVVPDHLVFFRVLFSRKIFMLVFAAVFRKNRGFALVNSIVLLSRDYYLLLFLPLRLHVYEKNGKIAGLATYLKRGNTMIMCQHIIADGYIRSGMFYKQMSDCINYAFIQGDVRYVSCAFTTKQAKETSGCHPINFLMTDEFRFMPFSGMEGG